MTRSSLSAAVLACALAGCDRPAPAAAPDPPTTSASAPAPTTTTLAASASATAIATASAPAAGKTTPPGPRAIPQPELACSTNADCVMTSDEIVDSPPRTYACCPGCTNRAGNVMWKKKFDAACTANPPPQCPPIGCLMQMPKPVCSAGACVLK